MKASFFTQRFQASKTRGIALVVTLLVIVILTIAVTAFMQSMSLERRTSQAYLNILKADEAANAGLQAALQQLLSYDTGGGARAPMPDFHYVVSKTTPANPRRSATTLVRLTPDSPVVLSTTELASRQPGNPRTYSFKFNNSTEFRDVDLVPIKNPNNLNVESYGYYVDSGTNKQTVIEPNKSTRSSLLSLGELPLIKNDSTALSATESSGLKTFTSANTFWKTLLLSPASLNQFTSISPAFDDWNVELDTWSPVLNQMGKQRVDLRRLKYYFDNLSTSQAPGNPRSLAVDALLNVANQALQANWGGGDLSWLVEPLNPKRYSLVEGRQIIANLIDYIDADIFPTTDSDTAPTYMGLEAHYPAGGTTLQGHPYINAVTTGLIFNRSTAGGRVGGLNSTRVLCTLGIVNPWPADTLPWGGSYSVEIETTVTGNVSGGTVGDKPAPYFGTGTFQKLDDKPPITSYPTKMSSGKIQANTGYAFPQPNSGSAGYATPFFTISPPQPANITFDNLAIVVKTLRLKYTSGTSSAYVQILNNLSAQPMAMKPTSVAMGKMGGSIILKYSNGAPEMEQLHLKGDPRLNFQSSDWYMSKTTESSELPPQPSTTPDVFSGMSATDGDGKQGVPSGANWYTNANMDKHLFARSTEIFGDADGKNKKGDPYNPKDTPYDPSIPVTPPYNQLAVTSTAELGYLFTGKPWQTLRMYQTAAASATTREDWTLLDSVTTGTFPLRDQKAALAGLSSVTGFINPASARDQALRSLVTSVPALSQNDADTLADSLKNVPAANLPFTSVGDVFKDSNIAWPNTTTDFAKEELARRIANMLTVSSQIFTIHSYGEALSPAGKVVARSRFHTTVELVPTGGKLVPKILQRIADPL